MTAVLSVDAGWDELSCCDVSIAGKIVSMMTADAAKGDELS